jgi:hypothetical protein
VGERNLVSFTELNHRRNTESAKKFRKTTVIGVRSAKVLGILKVGIQEVISRKVFPRNLVPPFWEWEKSLKFLSRRLTTSISIGEFKQIQQG